MSLKASTTDSDGKVTLGDLFDGAGAASDVLVANRTLPSITLDAAAVASLARRSGLDWSNPNGLLRINVVQGPDGTPTAAGASIPAATTAPAAAKGVDVLVYAASLNAGDPITAEDLVWAKMAAAPAGALANADALIGKVAKRPLRAGAAAAQADGMARQVIKPGDTVTVAWSSGAVTVTLQAKALAAAAVGQTFNVQNPTSKVVIQAIATGPGAAATGPGAQAAASATLLASR